jgi:hypothetical protein
MLTSQKLNVASGSGTKRRPEPRPAGVKRKIKDKRTKPADNADSDLDVLSEGEREAYRKIKACLPLAAKSRLTSVFRRNLPLENERK